MDDRTDLSAGYRGDTDYWADIHLNSDGKSVCGERDDVGSVNFGTVQWGKSAVTWAWNTTYWDKRLEADTELNKRYNWTSYGGKDGCGNEYDVEAIMTHEAGHWIGLSHPELLTPGEKSAVEPLTMFQNISTVLDIPAESWSRRRLGVESFVLTGQKKNCDQ